MLAVHVFVYRKWKSEWSEMSMNVRRGLYVPTFARKMIMNDIVQQKKRKGNEQE